MPLYDILNDFQKGHSHMAVVVKHNPPTEQQPIKIADGEDVKLDINNDKPNDNVVKPKRQLQKWKSYPSRAQSVSGGGGRSSRKWSKDALDDVLQIHDKPLPILSEEEEAIGVITMEDVIEELLQEEIFDETDHHEDQ